MRCPGLRWWRCFFIRLTPRVEGPRPETYPCGWLRPVDYASCCREDRNVGLAQQSSCVKLVVKVDQMLVVLPLHLYAAIKTFTAIDEQPGVL